MLYRNDSELDAYFDHLVDKFKTYQQVKSEIVWFVERTREFMSINNVEVRNIVEIGSLSGANLCMLNKLITVDAGKLISIEPEYHMMLDVQSISEEIGNTTLCHIKGTSLNPNNISSVIKYLNGDSVQLLFIDGNHDSSYAESDFNVYNHLVSKPGIIVIHDTAFMRNDICDQVGTFWNKIKREYPHESRYECQIKGLAGIGILYIV
jgi:predicted O-methyltransferase YrrM